MTSSIVDTSPLGGFEFSKLLSDMDWRNGIAHKSQSKVFEMNVCGHSGVNLEEDKKGHRRRHAGEVVNSIFE